jgi:dihydropteroate synthase-like protein
LANRLSSRPHYHFVTGRLAESLVRETVARLADEVGFAYSIQVLNITVAALLTVDWIAPRLEIPPEAERVYLPGWCRGDLSALAARIGLPVERGPKEIRELPATFGRRTGPPEGYGRYTVEILAEINHAPRLATDKLLALAERHRADGANLIDLGCEPGHVWSEIGDTVRRLRDLGFRVSVDSYDPREIGPATQAGAELVLSVNATNRDAAADWGVEVVVVPDDPHSLAGLEDTIAVLEKSGTRYRIDPILEPIGFGFAASLERYMQVRRAWPEAAMMMGIGNITELTDVDSAGVNLVLLAICEELRIESVLTTEVISWARSSVRECDLARRLVHWAVQEKTLPKRLADELVVLRDPRLLRASDEEIEALARGVRDRNVRVLLGEDAIHAINGLGHWQGDDPFELFARLAAADPKGISASHAFYLGYEMCKAMTALTLGKNYVQDEALRWGHLTRPEQSHRNVGD